MLNTQFEDETAMVPQAGGGFYDDDVIGPAGVLTPRIVDDILIAEGKSYKTVTNFSVPKGYFIIGHEAFKNCKQLRRVDLPDDIYYIGRSAFENCFSLEKIELPRDLECIDEYAFRSCESLQNVDFDNGGRLKIIGVGAFEDCYSLTEVYFPESVEVIDAGAFFHCRELRSVRFAKRGLKFLGKMAFGRCRRLWKFKESWFPKTLENREYRWRAFEGSTAGMHFSIQKIRFYRQPHIEPYYRG